MRRIFTTVSAFIVCGMMLTPVTEAQSRGRGRTDGGGGGSGAHRTETPARPGNNGSGPGRPGNNHSGTHQNNRPGNHNSGNNRPGNNGGNHNPGHGGAGQMNPGNHNPGNHNPGNNGGNHNYNRPGNHQPTPPPPSQRPPQRPPQNNYRPYHPPYAVNPPHRPHMYVNRPWGPPAPPPNWRPGYGSPRFTGILGILFGTALDVTLNSLINGGYTVTNYGPSSIYLTSVPMLNYTWPNATINFVNGVMRGSEFTYSTVGYDLRRYNNLYNDLSMRYGAPVSMQNNGNAVSATWWGYDNGYITLSFFRDYAYGGGMRYYTTLSIGN